MLIKELKITNVRGDSIIFGRHFYLSESFDLSNLSATINYSQTTADGAAYQSTTLDVREFDVPFFIKYEVQEPWWIEEKKNEAYRLFNPKLNPFRLDFTTEAGKEYYINANLQGTPTFSMSEEESNMFWQDGLLQFSANDPYIYENNPVAVDVAAWVGAFSFPLEIPEEGIEMGYRSPSLIVNVLNEGQEKTGMIIRFRALGTLENPSLFNVNTREELKLNFIMQGGDVIEVSTYDRRKKIKLIRNGVETNIFNSLVLTSKFLQADVGDNLFRYNADSGVDNLEVSVNFTPRLVGI